MILLCDPLIKARRKNKDIEARKLWI